MSDEKKRIAESIAIYDEVKKALDDGKLVRTSRSFKECNPGTDVARTIAIDRKKRARFYARSVNTDDTSLSFAYYFDTEVRLRYSVIGGASAEGALLEVKIAFAEDGTRLSEEHRTLAGPEWKFPDAWPKKDVWVEGPNHLYDAANSCGEATPPPKATPAPKAKKKP